jgi:hypothetical protein
VQLSQLLELLLSARLADTPSNFFVDRSTFGGVPAQTDFEFGKRADGQFPAASASASRKAHSHRFDAALMHLLRRTSPGSFCLQLLFTLQLLER